jgi:hypothetical protein
MIKEKEIKVVVLGEPTLEDKINYAKAVSRMLMSEYGRDACEKILLKLKEI